MGVGSWGNNSFNRIPFNNNRYSSKGYYKKDKSHKEYIKTINKIKFNIFIPIIIVIIIFISFFYICNLLNFK